MELKWGQSPSLHEEGLDRGVLYSGTSAFPWNGLIEVAESDTTETLTDYYFDGVRYVVVQNLGEFSAQIDCYTYPFELDSGGIYGFSYRVPYADGHKIHLVYNCMFVIQTRTYKTQSDGTDPSSLGWDLHATPIKMPGSNPVSHLIIDTDEYPSVTAAIEEILYGTATTNPRLPTPEEVIDICEAAVVLRITYNGDGSWTATGPDEMVQAHADGTFTLSAPTVHHIDDGSFVVSSF